MYEELVQRIRGCSYSDPNGCEECRNCPNAENYYECKQKLALQAADALEELNTLLDGVSADNDALCETIERLKKPRWIPVEERLPESRGMFLICCNYPHIRIAKTEMGQWYENAWFSPGDCEEITHFVTHWMPLPEPPKEEET